MADIDSGATPLLEARFDLGESPVWDEIEQALYFVDITAHTLHRYDWRSKALRSWQLPEVCGSMGLRRAGGAVVGLRASVHLFDFERGQLTKQLCSLPEEEGRPTNRLNDGKVAPDGRFWVGSMDERPEREAVAALYRIEPDGSYARAVDQIRLSNGLAWSPDGTVMYHADTVTCEVHAYDYDVRTGEVRQPRMFHAFDEAGGMPDGAAMDVEGFYWIAGARAGRLHRIAPDGTLERSLELPVRCPTMPCFGGPDMRTIFVTSMDRQLADDPKAGMVLTVRVEVPGLPAARFAG